MDPLTHQQLDQAKQGPGTFWHRTRSRLVRQETAKVDGTSIVDVGAGAGTLGEYLAIHAPTLEYSFSEPDPALGESLRHRFGAEREVLVTDSLDGFDVITIMDAMSIAPRSCTMSVTTSERTRCQKVPSSDAD